MMSAEMIELTNMSAMKIIIALVPASALSDFVLRCILDSTLLVYRCHLTYRVIVSYGFLYFHHLLLDSLKIQRVPYASE